eukprot:2268380-Rhodomonas_salina.2
MMGWRSEVGRGGEEGVEVWRESEGGGIRQWLAPVRQDSSFLKDWGVDVEGNEHCEAFLSEREVACD